MVNHIRKEVRFWHHVTCVVNVICEEVNEDLCDRVVPVIIALKSFVLPSRLLLDTMLYRKQISLDFSSMDQQDLKDL